MINIGNTNTGNFVIQTDHPSSENSTLNISKLSHQINQRLTCDKNLKMDAPLSNDQLATLLKETETEIDGILNDLKANRFKTKIVDSESEAQGAVIQLGRNVKGAAELGLDLFKDIVKSEDVILSGKIEYGKDLLYFGQAMVNAFDTGLTGLTLIYKRRLLTHSQQIVDKIKSHYTENGLEIPKKINKWETSIKNANAYVTGLKYNLESMTRVISLAEVPLNTFSYANIIPQGKLISNILAQVGAFFGFIVSVISLDESEKSTKTFSTWVKKYKAWQQNAQVSGNIDLLGQDSIPAVLPNFKMIKSDSRLSRNHFESSFDKLIHESRDFNHLISLLNEFDIQLDSHIKTKDQFTDLLKQEPNYHKKNFTKYVLYQRTMIKHNNILSSTQNLIVKREAVTEKKVLFLTPRFEELKPKLLLTCKSAFKLSLEVLIDEASSKDTTLENIEKKLANLGSDLPAKIKSTVDAHAYLISVKKDPAEFQIFYERWFLAQSKAHLLKIFIDHQETIEITTKNALKEMVSKKLLLTEKFIKPNRIESLFSFTFSTLTLACGTFLGGLALFSFPPIAAVTLILSMLDTLSTALGFGMMARGYYMNYKYQNACFNFETYFEKISLSLTNLFATIRTYQHLSNQKRLRAKEKIVSKLFQTQINKDDQSLPENLEKALKESQKAKNAFEIGQKKVDYWKNKSKTLSDCLKQKTWKDFAHFAKLKTVVGPFAYDPLDSLKFELEQSEFSLFDSETKELFEQKLGVDLTKIQKKMKKDPNALIYALRNFFTLSEQGVVDHTQ